MFKVHRANALFMSLCKSEGLELTTFYAALAEPDEDNIQAIFKKAAPSMRLIKPDEVEDIENEISYFAMCSKIDAANFDVLLSILEARTFSLQEIEKKLTF